jgi:hypothetical protein
MAWGAALRGRPQLPRGRWGLACTQGLWDGRRCGRVDGAQETEPFPVLLDRVGLKRVCLRTIFDNPGGAGTLHALVLQV